MRKPIQGLGAFFFVLVAVTSCASTPGVDRDGGPGDTTADTTPSEPPPLSPIVTFSLTIDYWCLGMPFGCDVSCEGTRAGAITYVSGTAQTGTLTDADRQRFIQFLDDPTTMAAVWDTTRCPMGALDVSYPVVLTLENGQTVRKDINGCRGPAYDAMREWMTTIESYFP